MDIARTNVHVTHLHGVREGSQAISIAICNVLQECVDLSNPKVRRRVHVLVWRDHLSRLSISERQRRGQLLRQYNSQFRNSIRLWLFNHDYSVRHETYLRRVWEMHLSFATESELKRWYPATSRNFCAILLQMLEVLAERVITINPDLIQVVVREMFRDSFQVNNVSVLYVSIRIQLICKHR